MLTVIAEMTERAETPIREARCHINWAALDRIPTWHEPVGVTQPDMPVMLLEVYPDGRSKLLYLEAQYQLSDEYASARLN